MHRLPLLRSLQDLTRTLGGALADLVYPPLCVGCSDRLPAHDPQVLPLCGPCRRRLHSPESGAVTRRLERLPQQPVAFPHALALWTFDAGGVLQRLQHALKYGDRPALGVRAGTLLGAAWKDAGYPLPDLIVPVPLSRIHLLERGYNQSERLAAGLRQELGGSVGEVLTRTRNTRTQTSLSRERRRHNVTGAFALVAAANLPPGTRVLIVDDVLTTGATAVAAAAPLVAAGATVDLAVLALASD